jgi:hypothetical protein
MSTFDHSAKATSSWLMISLMIPLATENLNHFGMALTLSNIASPKVHTSWPPPKASLSRNPSMGYISRNFMLKSSHSTLVYLFFSVFNLFSPPPLSKTILCAIDRFLLHHLTTLVTPIAPSIGRKISLRLLRISTPTHMKCYIQAAYVWGRQPTTKPNILRSLASWMTPSVIIFVTLAYSSTLN